PSSEKTNIFLVRTLSYKRNISIRRLVSYALLSVSTALRLLSLPRKADVIMCVGPVEEIFLVSLYCRLKKIPLVLDVVDLWPDLYLKAFPNWARPAARLLLYPYFMLAKAAYRRATHVTAVSDAYAQWAMHLIGRSDAQNFSFYYLGCHGGQFSAD